MIGLKLVSSGCIGVSAEQPGEIYEPLCIYQCQVEIGRNLMRRRRHRSSSSLFMRVLPVPQISEGFRATTNNYEENIVWSIGTFTTKQNFTEKWKTERRMRKSLRLSTHLE